MTAIFKRELKSYLTSMVGYLFIFFVLVLTGIYFSAYQLSAGYSKFESTLSALTFVFLIGVPILSMRVLAEERKQKTVMNMQKRHDNMYFWNLLVQVK